MPRFSWLTRALQDGETKGPAGDPHNVGVDGDQNKREGLLQTVASSNLGG